MRNYQSQNDPKYAKLDDYIKQHGMETLLCYLTEIVEDRIRASGPADYLDQLYVDLTATSVNYRRRNDVQEVSQNNELAVESE